MIENLYAGDMSREDFVEQGAQEMLRAYEEAKTAMGPVPEDQKDQLGLEDFERQLRQDVLSYHDQGIKVAFFDDGRYRPGGNRDAAMAEKLDRVIKDNPGSEVYVQAGLLHAQEDGRLPLLAGDGQGVSAGVGTARIDGGNPAAERLTRQLGDDAVLTIGLDQYNQYTKEDGPDREGKPYITLIDQGLSDVDYGRVGEGSGIPHASFDYIVPTYDETRFDPFADQ
jgi:hypothetical protein